VPAVVIGLNHRTMPLDLFERFTIDHARLPKALSMLTSCDNVTEAVVVSTCNRTEVYLVADRFHGAFQEVRDALSDLSHVASGDFADHLYVHYDEAAVGHLFRVASGVESDVLGDTDVLGQVRRAWATGVEEGSIGPGLNLLFRHAVETGKRARTDTGIARGTASVSHAAVEMATDHLGSIDGRTVLVVGTGSIGRAMAVAPRKAGAGRVLVANRTRTHAEELASDVGGEVVALADLGRAIVDCDVLLTSTGASSVIIDHGDLESVLARRGGAPLLVVDVAVPRDVDPAVGHLPGVTLFDIDDLQRFASAGARERTREIAAVEAIISDEVDRYTTEVVARSAAPLVASLHERAEAVRRAELDRHAGRLTGLSDRERAAVEAVTRGIVAKVLHDPTVAVKANAGTPTGDRLADSLRLLFSLDVAADPAGASGSGAEGEPEAATGPDGPARGARGGSDPAAG